MEGNYGEGREFVYLVFVITLYMVMGCCKFIWFMLFVYTFD